VGGLAGLAHHVTVDPIASVPVAVAVLVTVPAVLRAADVHVNVHVSVASSLLSLLVSPSLNPSTGRAVSTGLTGAHLSSETDTPPIALSAAVPPVVPFVSVYV